MKKILYIGVLALLYNSTIAQEHLTASNAFKNHEAYYNLEKAFAEKESVYHLNLRQQNLTR